MPKRKRDEIETASSASVAAPKTSDDRVLKRRRKLCAQRITAAHKPLVAALRLAAGFERQKFSRRKKTSQQKNDAKAVARLDAEYATLKTIDINKLAEQHLRKVINKVKSLRESDALPDTAKVIERADRDPAMLNVQARLYKVDAVKRIVDEAIEDLKIIVQDAPAMETTRQKSFNDESEDDDMFAGFDARIAAPSSGDDDSEDSLADDLRPSSEEEGENEGDCELDESLTSESEELPAHPSAVDVNSASRGLSGQSESDSDSDSDEASIPLPKSKRKTQKLEAQNGVYIPSLSHAAYYSGSESEASDLDAKFAPRKNRRGQRARQKIWEQKFGEKAQHVKKQQQQQERSQGWDAKRGAVSDRRRGRGDKIARRGPERTGENAVPLGVKKPTRRDDTGPLHPSWIAAKAAKEKALVAKPQGKKMVFD